MAIGRREYTAAMSPNEIFLRGLASAPRAALADLADLAAVLDQYVAAAHAAWPEIAVDDDAFLAHLAARFPDDAGEAHLRSVRATDVYLALACARGDQHAIAQFERAYFGEIKHAVFRARAGETIRDELEQIMRRILFVAEPTRPAAVAAFSGRGDLRGWIRVTAMREVIRLLGRDQREVKIDDDALFDLLSPANDPELAYIRDLYRAECSAAFRSALDALSVKDRSLLRYQALDGLTVAEIGAIHGVHGATASRWISRIRDELLETTRTEVQRRLGIATHEVDSILRLVHSRLDVSLERVLGPAPAP